MRLRWKERIKILSSKPDIYDLWGKKVPADWRLLQNIGRTSVGS